LLYNNNIRTICEGGKSMRILAGLLIAGGLFFLTFGGYQIFETSQAQKKTLAEAEERLEIARKEKNKIDPVEEATKFDPGYGESIGKLLIPKLGAELPIVEGIDENDLAQGVGHYTGTAFPLQNDQIVLSGHRDTVFRGMGKLEIGDLFIVEMEYGKFTYEIVETFITDPDDRTVIVPHDEEILTVTTCYPFNFIGSAPQRYIVNALPVDVDED